MLKKLFVLIMMLLITTSSFVIFSNRFEVTATPGEGGGSEENDIGLDYDWMWDKVIKDMCDAAYEPYKGLKILRGREFGTIGEHWAADKIQFYMDSETDCGLKNVDQIPLGPIPDLGDRFYTSRLNVSDYLLHIDISSENFDHDIPVNESFVIPSHQPIDKIFGADLTYTFTLPDEDDIRIMPDVCDPYVLFDLINDLVKWPFSGTFTNYSCWNLSITPTNNYEILIGNATYFNSSGPLPEDQDGRVFILNENQTTENNLDNVTNATGILLIHDNQGESSYKINKTAIYNFSICRVESDEINLEEVLNDLENESMIVDNVFDNSTLTFTKNLSQACLPVSDYVWLTTRGMYWYSYYAYGKFVGSTNLSRILNATLGFFLSSQFFKVLNRVNDIWDGPDCKGYISYVSEPYGPQINDSHYMNAGTIPVHKGGWFRSAGFKLFGRFYFPFVFGMPALPIFFVNNSIGLCLVENWTEALISGYVDQEYLEEKHPFCGDWEAGVTAYNVIGNLTTDKSGNPLDLDDPTVLISNRYDGWWNECPFDSGCGTGVVLAIAKYFNDYDITPKVNITFLETTGEEYIFRGAQHFSDSHPNMNYSMWIGFDQLAGDWNDKLFEITYNDNNIKAIVENISNEHGYPKRTNNGYKLEHNVTPAGSAAEEDVWKQRNLSIDKNGIGCKYGCKTICFANEKLPFRHKRGEMKNGNFITGDIRDNIDREDLNDTLELAWNITKYFTVNPDCWFNDSKWNITTSDSEDVCSFNDTVTAEFDVRSTLPHDKAMLNVSLMKSNPEIPDTTVMCEVMNFTVNRSWVTKNVSFTLRENDDIGQYYLIFNLSNSTGRINQIMKLDGNNINVTTYSYDIDDEFMFLLYPYDSCGNPPDITNINATPDTVGFGFNVTISADVTSNVSSEIDAVEIIITSPDFSMNNFTMTNTVNDTYEYVFNNTWKYGRYRYWIWAKDEHDNESGSSWYYFDVSAKATVSVCTIKDSYGSNEIVNLTDPLGNNGDSSQEIGYELLDEGKVLHIWNRFDSYYFNTSNGIQFTNHKDDYWSHNVLMLGYYNNDVWNLIYRTDELSGFNKNITSENETFVNATLWKDLTYQGYDFRLAIRYYLGVDDNELTVIPYIKNLDEDDIPYVLGFGWEIKDIQVDMTPSGDYIEINGTSYLLNQSLDETYKDMDSPCYFIREDLSDTMSKSLYLRWDNNLTYRVRVKSRDGQYNAPVSLFIRIGTLDASQEKYTELYWYDADQITYFFNGYNVGEAWPVNPSYMVDGDENTYASTGTVGTVELCNNNTCNGSYLGCISNAELRVKGYRNGFPSDIILRPVYNGITDGNDYTFNAPSGAGNWSEWFDIPPKTAKGWNWSEIKNLDCDVESDCIFGDMFTLYCSKVELRVTYTTNFAPVITNPYPENGSIGIGIAPTLSITVADADGDNMNIIWRSNSSGSWQVFGTNYTQENGTFYQVFNNASVNGQWWYWNVTVSDGKNITVSDIFSFFTGNESKIHNTGNTNFSGYLLMRIDYYNETSEEWEVDKFVIDDKSTPRIINSSEKLPLDTIFNLENVNTSSFSHGNGTYRVYAALRDPWNNVLYVCDDFQSQSSTWWYLEDWHEFTVTGI